MSRTNKRLDLAYKAKLAAEKASRDAFVDKAVLVVLPALVFRTASREQIVASCRQARDWANEMWEVLQESKL